MEKQLENILGINLLEGYAYFNQHQSANDYKQLCSEANEMSKLIRRQMGDD